MPDRTRLAWGAALALFVVGDLASTAYGLGPGGAVEMNPLPRVLLAQWGFGSFVVVKLLALGLVAALARGLAERMDERAARWPWLAGGLTLAVLGAGIVAWNLSVLLGFA